MAWSGVFTCIWILFCTLGKSCIAWSRELFCYETARRKALDTEPEFFHILILLLGHWMRLVTLGF